MANPKGVSWKLLIRKFTPNPKRAPEKKTLGQRFARTFDLIELKGLKAGFKGEANFLGGGIKFKKMKLDAESMVRIANALQNTGRPAQTKVVNYFIQRHFLNYFREKFTNEKQIAILERLITPYGKTNAKEVLSAFRDITDALTALLRIMKERDELKKQVKLSEKDSPPTKELKGPLTADLFNTALGGMTWKVDAIKSVLEQELKK